MVDYNAISKGTKKFTDANFPLDDALYWKDVGEEDCDWCEMKDIMGDIEWKRVSDSDFPEVTFFGPKGISSVNPEDIN